MTEKERRRIGELRNVFNGLFVLKAQSPLEWISRDIEKLMGQIYASVETLEEIDEYKRKGDDEK